MSKYLKWNTYIDFLLSICSGSVACFSIFLSRSLSFSLFLKFLFVYYMNFFCYYSQFDRMLFFPCSYSLVHSLVRSLTRSPLCFCYCYLMVWLYFGSFPLSVLAHKSMCIVYVCAVLVRQQAFSLAKHRQMVSTFWLNFKLNLPKYLRMYVTFLFLPISLSVCVCTFPAILIASKSDFCRFNECYVCKIYRWLWVAVVCES